MVKIKQQQKQMRPTAKSSVVVKPSSLPGHGSAAVNPATSSPAGGAYISLQKLTTQKTKATWSSVVAGSNTHPTNTTIATLLPVGSVTPSSSAPSTIAAPQASSDKVSAGRIDVMNILHLGTSSQPGTDALLENIILLAKQLDCSASGSPVSPVIPSLPLTDCNRAPLGHVDEGAAPAADLSISIDSSGSGADSLESSSLLLAPKMENEMINDEDMGDWVIIESANSIL